MALGNQPIRRYGVALLSVLCMVAFIFLLPQLCIKYSKDSSFTGRNNEHFKLGLENISHDFLCSLTSSQDLSYTAALVTNLTGRDQMGNRNIDVLLQKGLNVKKIYIPGGELRELYQLGTITNPAMRIPIVDFQKKQLKTDDFKGIDVIFFDVQDVGICYRSSLAILVQIMEIAGCSGKTIVVLDRPNLLGDAIEGVFCGHKFHDSLAAESLPLRYGMTIGELAHYCNKYVLKDPAHLYVVPMDHYNRHMHSHYTFIGKLSSDINSIEACHGYSFLGLLAEVSPFDIGIGTDKAFQCILLPERMKFSQRQWFSLKKQLMALGIDSTSYRCYSKHKKEFYSGLRVCIRDISNFSLLRALIETLDFFKKEGISLGFSKKFCSIPGMSKIKELIDGTINREEFEAQRKYELEHFFVMASSSFMYKPYPKVLVI